VGLLGWDAALWDPWLQLALHVSLPLRLPSDLAARGGEVVPRTALELIVDPDCIRLATLSA
jgi:hypothetical protein